MKQVKRIVCIAMGFFPMQLFGYYVNHLILNVYYDVLPPYFLFGAAVIAAWFAFGMISIFLVRSRKEAVLLLNLPAFLVLMLIMFQEWVLAGMWMNQIGLAIQHFYLPILRLGVVLTNIIPRPIMPVIYFSVSVAFAFICMLGTSYLGRRLSERISSTGTDFLRRCS